MYYRIKTKKKQKKQKKINNQNIFELMHKTLKL